MKTKRGFTLIEMLTVIMIMGILAGITLKLMVYVNQKTAKSRTTDELERIKHALTEYYAVYGCYPPVNVTRYEFLSSSYAAMPDEGLGLSDGLCTYLWADPGGNQERWLKYLEHLLHPDSIARSGNAGGYGKVNWTNTIWTIRDSWDNEYIYTTRDPYQTYKIFSKGPDGQPNTEDDIGNKWTE
jgi:prepilin-type N-terminal cleavage/methylation domain-containing protein